jgi:hypothetical protein
VQVVEGHDDYFVQKRERKMNALGCHVCRRLLQHSWCLAKECLKISWTTILRLVKVLQ